MKARNKKNKLKKIIFRAGRLTYYAFVLAVIWSIIISLFATWNIYQKKQTTIDLATETARTHFSKDQAFRLWSTTHGGVYVPIDKRTPSNPHLKHLPERDIITPSGKKLTLMNPAYMLRQLMEEYSNLYNIKGRITSLKPFRPQNAPDKWEKSALEAFENGVKEVFEFVDIDNEPYLRLIRPMIAKKGCLKCHGYQGYKVGDVRGGVGVSVPMSPYLIHESREVRKLLISHFLIWLLGICGIYSGFLGLKHRIAERDHAETALRENEHELSATLNSIGDAVIATDIEGKVARMNPVAEKLTGWAMAEALGHPLSEIFNIINVITRRSVESPHNKVLRKGDIVELADHTVLIAKGGAEFQIADSGAPIRKDDGLVHGVVLVFRDVTKEYHMKKALKESEVKYRTMMESMKEPVYIGSVEYIVEYMNPAMIKRTGRDATGEKCYNALHGLDERCPWCVRDKVLQQDYFETNIVSPKDNRSFHVSYSPLLHVDGSMSVMTVFRDTTKMQQMESQLRQAQKMESLGTLAGGIAHDFNNILFPIVGYTEMLLADAPDNSRLKHDLNEIFAGAKRASDLIKQILIFSRQREHDLKPIKVQLVIQEVLKLIRASLPATIEINKDIDKKAGLVMADPTQIHQIAMNLITNAYHAMEHTGGKLNVILKQVELTENDIIHSVMKPGQYLCLVIADTGTGMDKSISDRIFDPYFTTKEDNKGTGLGLAVVHGIVKSHGGHINVYSEPGKGTEFHVYLPVIQSKEEADEIKPSLPLENGNERILLIDDRIEIVSLLNKMLEKLGYHVTCQNSSMGALDTFSLNPQDFDLVITDLTMPDMTGEQLAKEMTRIRPDIPVILCTGFSEKISRKKELSMGIKGVLIKPVVMKDLATKIRKVLDGD